MVPKVIGDLPYGECAITRIGVGGPCQKTAIYSSVQKNMLCFHSMNIWMKPPEIKKKETFNKKSKSLTVYPTISYSNFFGNKNPSDFFQYNMNYKYFYCLKHIGLHYIVSDCFYLPHYKKIFYMVHIIKLWLLMHEL